MNLQALIHPNIRTIALDGRGGSGKSTLARLWQAQIPQAALVPIDDFYLPESGKTDRQRVLEQVLIPHAKGEDTRYQRYDWETQQLGNWIPIRAGEVLILEGIMALHPDFLPYLDLKIWLECDPQTAFARGLYRDRFEYGVETEAIWRELWIPNEQAYMAEFKPQEQADLVLHCE